MLRGARLLGKVVSGQPVLCNWQITYRCDFECAICTFWREEHRRDEELSIDEVRAVARTLRPLAPLLVSLTGGEPLLREDLPDVVRVLAREHYVSLITNGWHLTPALARDLYAAGLGDAHVSIDYADPDRHDGQRGRQGAFERAVRALQTLRDVRPTTWHGVRIMTVVLDDNVDQLEGLLLLAEELSVTLAMSLYSDRLGCKPRRLPADPVVGYLRELKRRHPGLVSASGYLGRFDEAVRGDLALSCGAGRTFLDIDDRGRAARCIDRNDRPVGDLLREPLDVVLARLRADAAEDPCDRCWTSCRGLADVIAGPGGVRAMRELVAALRPM